MVTLNWMAILVCSLVMFAGGALWYGPIFGKLWMRIHHGEQKFTDAQMKKMMEGMWKLMLTEFIAGFIMIMTLDFLIKVLPPGLAPGQGPALAGAHAGFLVWLGFVLPTMISTVIWGSDMKKWMATKIVVSASYRLIALLAAGYILGMW